MKDYELRQEALFDKIKTDTEIKTKARQELVDFINGLESPELLKKEMLNDIYKVFEHGVAKHGALNYMNPDGNTCGTARTIGSMINHLAKVLKGEFIDSDSLLPHMYHVACRASIYNYRLDNNIVHPEDTGIYMNCTCVEAI